MDDGSPKPASFHVANDDAGPAPLRPWSRSVGSTTAGRASPFAASTAPSDEPRPGVTSLQCFLRRPEPSDFLGRLDYVDGLRRLQSTTLLLVGASSGILGFAFAGFLGIYKYKRNVQSGTNYRGEPFGSGKHYHPATVSEMVNDPKTPEGKAFFAFCMLGVVCILVSAYPWCLRNVFIGHRLSRNIRPLCGRAGERPIWVNLLTLRQFMPPIGLMLVVCITVTSGPRTFPEKVACSIHTFGAVMMFVSYIAFEFHALWWSPVLKPTIRGPERFLRKWLAIGALICSVGFQSCGMVAAMCPHFCRGGVCSCDATAPYSKLCLDEWRVPSQEDILLSKKNNKLGSMVREEIAHEDNDFLLLNTARGWYAHLKVATYWLEVFAGLLLLGSHLVIWYFCPERHVELGGELPDIQNQYRRMDRGQRVVEEGTAAGGTW